jgi:hypothetical protein
MKKLMNIAAAGALVVLTLTFRASAYDWTFISKRRS